MSQALGRVLQKDDLEGPRGPDARHRVTVPSSWMSEGRWIELDLPRMLECAKCSGGGCDACDRSGAVVTRGRKELPEVVEVKLPEGDRGVTLRLPKRGGLAADDKPELGRGILLLSVVPGDAASDGVRVMDVAVELVAAAPAAAARPRYLSPAVLLAAAVVLFVVLLVFTLTR